MRSKAKQFSKKFKLENRKRLVLANIKMCLQNLNTSFDRYIALGGNRQDVIEEIEKIINSRS